MRSTVPNVGRYPTNCHSSACVNSYHFVWSFKSHDVDGVGSDANEQKTHAVEVEWTPVILQYHIGVASDEDNHVHLLGSIGNANNIFVG